MMFSIRLLFCIWIALRMNQPASKLPSAQKRSSLLIEEAKCFLGGTGVTDSVSQRKL